MPYIRILGMPDDVDQEALRQLTMKIQEAVGGVEGFDAPQSEAFVFYSPDLQKAGLGEELIAMIEGVFVKPERTPAVLESLRVAVNGCLESFALYSLPQCERTETFISSMVSPSECTMSDLKEIRCPSCGGRGGGSDECCSFCGGSGRKAD